MKNGRYTKVFGTREMQSKNWIFTKSSESKCLLQPQGWKGRSVEAKQDNVVKHNDLDNKEDFFFCCLWSPRNVPSVKWGHKLLFVKHPLK